MDMIRLGYSCENLADLSKKWGEFHGWGNFRPLREIGKDFESLERICMNFLIRETRGIYFSMVHRVHFLNDDWQFKIPAHSIVIQKVDSMIRRRINSATFSSQKLPGILSILLTN
jgi:hypothetical protein